MKVFSPRLSLEIPTRKTLGQKSLMPCFLYFFVHAHTFDSGVSIGSCSFRRGSGVGRKGKITASMQIKGWGKFE